MQVETVRQMVKELIAKRPDLATRAERAGAILATRQVKPVGVPGMWWVESQSKPGTLHLVTMNGERTCDCYDHANGRAPQGWCKHLIAVASLVKAQDRDNDRRSQVFAHLVEKGMPVAAALEGARAS